MSFKFDLKVERVAV